MYHLFNTDNLTAKKVHKSELYDVLTDLKNRGAIFSLDIDCDICYSFTDNFESEDIEILLTDASFH